MALAKGTSTLTYVALTNAARAVGDLLKGVTQSGFNKSRVEIDTSEQGSDQTTFLLGRKSIEVPITINYDSADTVHQRIEGAHDNDTTVFVHHLPDGLTGKKVECRVPSFQVDVDSNGKAVATFTFKSVGAVAAST